MHGPMAPDLRHAYQAALKFAGRIESPSQLSIIDRLQPFLKAEMRGPTRTWFNWPGFVRQEQRKSGAYIYGDVGTGKTMIMDLFYDAFPPAGPGQKLRQHFHQFMLQTHSRAHELRKSGIRGDHIIERIADELGKRHRLICLDEFQVVDIADAMILKGLLEALFTKRITLLVTSNRPPNDLYMNGIQRRSFLPCIELIKERLEVLQMEGQQDYRLQSTSTAKTDQYYCVGSVSGLESLFKELAEGQRVSTKDIWTMGRTIHVKRCTADVAWFGFAEIFRSPLSAVDYLAIANSFDTIFIENIPAFHSADLRIEARRFVTFIDILYDLRKRLAVHTQVPLNQLFKLKAQNSNSVEELELADELNVNRGAALFTGAEEQFAVARAYSRIHQMTGQAWWNSHSQNPDISASG